MRFITLSALAFHASASSITFDPEAANYEEVVFNYVQSLGPVVTEDPFFLASKSGNSSQSVRGGKLTHADFDLRRLRQLKLVIVAVMSVKMINEAKDAKDQDGNSMLSGSGFGRYCFYGCHCLPDAEHSVVSKPMGTPIDKIDETCKQMGTCYKCLEHKYNAKKKECKPEDTNYKYEIIEEEITIKGKKYKQGVDIICNAKGNSECAQDVCLCDRQFAMDVKEHETKWDVKYHSNKSNFVREKECKKKPAGNNGNNNRSPGPPATCCGSLPLVTAQKRGDKCCGYVSYNDKTKECCNQNTSEVLTRGLCMKG